jgi:hypothetical protein
MACFVELTLIEINNMEVIGPIIVNFTKVKYFAALMKMDIL